MGDFVVEQLVKITIDVKLNTQMYARMRTLKADRIMSEYLFGSSIVMPLPCCLRTYPVCISSRF